MTKAGKEARMSAGMFKYVRIHKARGRRDLEKYRERLKVDVDGWGKRERNSFLWW